jgi:hypothetical protein
VPGYAVDVYQGYDVVSPLSPAVSNISGLSRAKASFAAASTPSWRTLSEIDSNTGTSTFSLSEVDSNAVSPRPRSSQRIQRSNARSQEVTFARGVVDNTPRAVDAAMLCLSSQRDHGNRFPRSIRTLDLSAREIHSDVRKYTILLTFLCMSIMQFLVCVSTPSLLPAQALLKLAHRSDFENSTETWSSSSDVKRQSKK